MISSPFPSQRVYIRPTCDGLVESLADVAERCRSLLDDVAARDLPAIVLVTHGDTMRVLLGILDGRSHRDLDWDLPLTNGSVIARDVNLSESHRRLSLS